MAETTFVQDAPVAEEASWASAPFRLGGESYGLDIVLVQEVIRSQKVFPVPTTPPYVLGVINLRNHHPDRRHQARAQANPVAGGPRHPAVDPSAGSDRRGMGRRRRRRHCVAARFAHRALSYEARRTGAQVRRSDRRVSEQAALALVDGPRLIGDLRIRG